jgi:hypothetical protein
VNSCGSEQVPIKAGGQKSVKTREEMMREKEGAHVPY